MRIAIFFILLTSLTLLQRFFPKRNLPFKFNRVLGNLALLSCSNLLLKSSFILSVYDWCTKDSSLLLIIFHIIILDLSIYLQHVLSHKVNLFWRFHKVHHSDEYLDVSTALRFHPVELIASYFYKAAIIYIFKIDLLAFIIFEILLSSMAMFNHANLRINKRVDRVLQFILVTPDMHRVHHFKEKLYFNSNFGFNLSLWDRVFKTYKTVDFKQQDELETGLANEGAKNFFEMLVLPFKK